VAILSLVAAYFGHLWHRAESRNRALATIASAGAVSQFWAASHEGPAWSHVSFWQGKLTDRDLFSYRAELGALPNLNLVLTGNEITDDGLRHLAGLMNLRTLVLERTNITDHGLAQLARLPNLRHLDLSGTSVTDDGLEHLAEIEQLESLALRDTEVGDEGVARLKNIAGLDAVDLENTNITDAGLEHLAEMPQLSVVSLAGTKITASGAERLQEALPSCDILLEPGGRQPASTSEDALR